MKFTKTNVSQILSECEAALAAVAARHGLKVVRKNCSYSALEMPVAFKLQATETDEDGNVITAEAQEFMRCAVAFGLKPEDLGRAFTTSNGTYVVAGLKSRNRKYPVLATSKSNGKTYKFPADVVKRTMVEQPDA